jgi:hypothetical protein
MTQSLEKNFHSKQNRVVVSRGLVMHKHILIYYQNIYAVYIYIHIYIHIYIYVCMYGCSNYHIHMRQEEEKVLWRPMTENVYGLLATVLLAMEANYETTEEQEVTSTGFANFLASSTKVLGA